MHNERETWIPRGSKPPTHCISYFIWVCGTSDPYLCHAPHSNLLNLDQHIFKGLYTSTPFNFVHKYTSCGALSAPFSTVFNLDFESMRCG